LGSTKFALERKNQHQLPLLTPALELLAGDESTGRYPFSPK